MQLRPRYEGEPIIRIDGLRSDPIALMNAQRERLARILSTLDEGEWAAPSRCDGWTVQDVVTHLVSTNQFWEVSVALGLQGRPTRYLASFDPVATPLELVGSVGDRPPEETLADFVESNRKLATALESADGRVWNTLAEAPPGHVSIGCVVLHALWDSLIHEWDIVVPLGRELEHQAEDVEAALTYAAALSPAMLMVVQDADPVSIALRGTDPDMTLTIEMDTSVRVSRVPAPDDAVAIEGDSRELLEAFSRRGPLNAEVEDADRRLFEGLATVFDER